MRGVDGREYDDNASRPPPSPPHDWEKKLAFFESIVGGKMDTFNKYVAEFANDTMPAQVAFVGPVFRIGGGGPDVLQAINCPGVGRGLGDVTDAPLDVVIKLHQRIEAERTPSGKRYIPATCDSYPHTYNLPALAIAYLYGRQEMVKRLLANGASKTDTVTIYYHVPNAVGMRGSKLYSDEWTPDRFAFPSQSAKGGRRTRTRRVRRRTATRRLRRT